LRLRLVVKINPWALAWGFFVARGVRCKTLTFADSGQDSEGRGRRAGRHRLQTGATRVGREEFRRRGVAEVCTTINEALMVVAPRDGGRGGEGMLKGG